MNQEPENVNPEKLVHRLLDTIDRKDVQLEKLRQQIEVTLVHKHAATETNILERDSSSLASVARQPDEQGMLLESRVDTASSEGLPQFFATNRTFIYITIALLLVAIAVTLWPKSSQIAHLSEQLNEAAERHRIEAAAAEAALSERDKTIVQLQKELAGTQKALTDNESALMRAEKTLRLALHEDSSAETRGAASVQSSNTVGDELSNLKVVVTRLRGALLDVQRALVDNNKEYVEVARALASNEAQCFNTNLAIEVESGKLDARRAEALKKTPDEYLPEKIRLGLNKGMVTDTYEYVGFDLHGELPVTIEGLRDLAVKYGSVLEDRQGVLATTESKILELQKRLVLAIEKLKKAQESLSNLRHSKQPPVSS